MVAFSIQASKWVSEGDTENREKKGVKKLTLHRFSLSRLCATISASDRGSVRNGDRLSPGLQPRSTAQISRKSEAMGSFGSRAHPALPHETWEGGVGG